MPTFKEDADAFRKGPSGFKMKYKKSSFPFKGDGRAESSAFQANEYQGGIMPQTYGTVPSPSKKRTKGEMKANPDHGFAGQIASPMMKKKKTSPHETVKKLQAKKSAGTITPPELKKLNKLMKEMDQFYKDQSAPSYRGNYDEID